MKTTFAVALSGACLLLAAEASAATCTKDYECAGDLICAGGECVSRTPTAAPQPVVAQPIVARPVVAPPVVAAPAPQPAPVAPAPAPASDARKPLKTTAGTLMLGGNLSLSANILVPESGSLKTGGGISIDPNVGIFVANHLCLRGELTLGRPFGDLAVNPVTDLGLAVGLLGYPNLGTFGAIYAGGLLGFELGIPETGSMSKRVYLTIPFGVLVALNEHLGLDVGLRINASVNLYDNYNYGFVSTALGYFGLQGFF